MYGIVEYLRYVMFNDDLSDEIYDEVICVFSTREEAEKFINDIYKLIKESDNWHEDLDEADEYYFKDRDHITVRYGIKEVPLGINAKQVFDNLGSW